MKHTMIWILLVSIAAAAVAAADERAVRKALLAGIETNFSGDYDRASKLFDSVGKIDPRHPARELYLAITLFWRNNVDPSNPRHDKQISELLGRAIGKAEAWLDREHESVEALHYAGMANIYLGRLEAHRGRLYAGGCKGEDGRDYLDKAVALCRTGSHGSPMCEDNYFPLGSYSYFAGRLPGIMRALNFLWFVPRGSTSEGLEMLERVRNRGELHRLGATSLLASIYSRFEPGKERRALTLSSNLVKRFPDNPHLDLEHGRILNLNGRHEDAGTWAGNVLGKNASGLRNYDHVVVLGARLIMTEAALEEKRLDEAERILRSLEKNPSYQSNTLTPLIALGLGKLADARGKREEAVTYYKKVKQHDEGRTCNRQAIKRAERFLDEPYRP